MASSAPRPLAEASLPPPPKRPRNWVGRRETRLQELLAGPVSSSELFEWPASIARSLVRSGSPEDEEMRLRLRGVLSTGVLMYTDYSGIDAPRFATEYAMRGLEEELGMKFASSPIKSLRTCDHGQLQTEFLIEISRGLDDSKSCHFRDLMDRLPPMAQQRLNASTPHSGASKLEKEQAFKDIKKWLHDNREIAYPESATSWCCVHDKPCPVRLERCHVFEKTEEQQESSLFKPLRVNVAGVTCVAWSSQGRQERGGHSSEMAHHIWSTERFRFMETGFEDIAFIECVPKYPAKEKLGSAMQGLGTIMSLVDGPEHHGWPHRRRRSLSVILNNQTVRWVGPTDYVGDFTRRFARATVLTGDQMLVATEKEVHEEYARMARTRKHRLTAMDVPTMSNSELLPLLVPPGAVHRLEAWRSWWQEHPDLAGRPFCCDLEHWPHTKGSTGGPDLPVILTHGTTAALGIGGDVNAWRLATPLELLGAMGWPVHPQECGRFGVLLVRSYFEAMSSRQMKVAIGNSMHLVTQAAWMLYILSNVARVPVAKPEHMLRLGSKGFTDFDDDAEDDADHSATRGEQHGLLDDTPSLGNPGLLPQENPPTTQGDDEAEEQPDGDGSAHDDDHLPLSQRSEASMAV